MSDFDHTDQHYLLAAEGWLELGNAYEAHAEWERLSPAAKEHVAALELRWQILARLGQWDTAVEVAEKLVASAPELCAGWLHRAFALRRATGGGLERAWSALRPAADHFPEEDLVAYNLACYATQMGRLDEGWEWFLRAVQITDDSRRLRRMGLKDADLKPLWPRIRGLRPA
jgi:tetratricopeptide (TPR) repeat protein